MHKAKVNNRSLILPCRAGTFSRQPASTWILIKEFVVHCRGIVDKAELKGRINFCLILNEIWSFHFSSKWIRYWTTSACKQVNVKIQLKELLFSNFLQQKSCFRKLSKLKKNSKIVESLLCSTTNSSETLFRPSIFCKKSWCMVLVISSPACLYNSVIDPSAPAALWFFTWVIV